MHINKFIAFFPVIAIILLSEIFLGLGTIVMPAYIPILGMLLVILFIVFCIRLHWGLYFLIFTVPLDIGHLIFDNNFAPKGMRNTSCSINIFLVALIVFLLAWLVRAASTTEHNDKFTLQDSNIIFILLLLLINWNVISLFWTPNLYVGFIQLIKLLANICIFFLFYYCIDSSEVLRRVIWAFLFLGIIMSVISFWSIYGVELSEEITKIAISGRVFEFYFEIVENVALKIEWVIHRSRGTAHTSPAELAFILNIIIALGFGLLLATKKEESGKRFGLITIIIFIVSAQLSALSKGGAIGLFALTYFFLFTHRLRKKFIKNSFIFISGVFVLFLIVQNTEFFSTGVLRMTEATVYSSGPTRLGYWSEVLELFFHKTMGTGLGIGGAKFYLSPVPHLHSIYLSILCDMGIVGVLLVSFLIAIVVKEALPVIQYQKTFLQIMLLGSCGAMISIAAHGSFDFHYNTNEIWMIGGVGMAALRLAKQELAEQKQPARGQ